MTSTVCAWPRPAQPGQPTRTWSSSQRVLHLRPRLPRGIQGRCHPLRRGLTIDRDEMLASWSTSNTSAAISTSSVARSASGATVSNCTRPTRVRFTGSSSGVMRSTAALINPTSGETIECQEDKLFIYPAVHYVMPEERIDDALRVDPSGARPSRSWPFASRASCSRPSGCCAHQVRHGDDGRGRLLLRASRTTAATLRAVPRASGRTRCYDYFPDDFLLFIDESHVTIPQLGAMYNGDRNRKRGAGGPRLPPAQRTGQSPAAVRGDRSALAAGGVRQRHAGPYELRRAAAKWSNRSSARPAWWTRCRSRAARGQVADLCAGQDPGEAGPSERWSPR
jgi:hypothetical protein